MILIFPAMCPTRWFNMYCVEISIDWRNGYQMTRNMTSCSVYKCFYFLETIFIPFLCYNVTFFFYKEWTASKYVEENTGFYHRGPVFALNITGVSLLCSRIISCDAAVMKGTDSVMIFQEWRVGQGWQTEGLFRCNSDGQEGWVAFC